ncbi:MAG TPA: A/G-specific adenine glycosylase, partial [Candidatus Kapabacteria bacterium]|nr:A/G-specific adenine glycosylase [Candidatus Kapabacteria bacterium]
MQTKKPLLPRKINALHTALLGWYGKNGRKFQWRESRDPYVILVSEVMLQQTQTARVAEKLPAFLRRFPTVAALARAPRAAVIRAWQGMGYN